MRPKRIYPPCGGLVLSMLGCGLLATVPALAQTAQPEPDDAGIEDIVVTAQKRAERLQDVPISVSAISGDQLVARGIRTADDLVSFAPNLQVSSTVGENTPIFSLRGVSMSDYSLSQASPVATYYDEVYKGNFALLGIALYDLERVEVLRGPQGTLYGKNTTGGAVNLIARRPSFETGGELSFGYGNYDRFDINGAIETHAGDSVAARVAFTYAKADGWFRNRLPGFPDKNGVDELGVRGTVVVKPTDRFGLILRASYSRQRPQNYGVLAENIPPEGFGPGVYQDPATPYLGPIDAPRRNGTRDGLERRELDSNVDARRSGRTYSLSATANWDVADAITLTSVTSWDKGRLFNPEDTDGIGLRALEVDYFGRAEQFAQDLRVASDGSGPFGFIAGAYYNRETVFNRTDQYSYTDVDFDGSGALDADDCDGFFFGCQVSNQFNQTKISYALYSDLSYKLGDRITLRGGLRFTHDQGRLRDLFSEVLGNDGTVVARLIPGTGTGFNAQCGLQTGGTVARCDYSSSNVSGKIGVDFKPSRDVLIYASVSKGYRAPSFNALAFFDPSELTVAREEKITAYEAGFKTQLINRKLQLNGAAFWYDYTDQQFLDPIPDAGTTVLVNLPRSRIFGGELELRAFPVEDLTLSAGLGLLDTKLLRGTLRGGLPLRGNELLNAPAVSLNGAVDWIAAQGKWGTVSAHANGSYFSSQYFDIFNVRRIREPGYALLNGRIEYRSPEKAWSLAAWVKNATGTYYRTSRIDLQGFGYDYAQLGEPRTYGVTAGLRF